MSSPGVSGARVRTTRPTALGGSLLESEIPRRVFECLDVCTRQPLGSLSLPISIPLPNAVAISLVCMTFIALTMFAAPSLVTDTTKNLFRDEPDGRMILVVYLLT